MPRPPTRGGEISDEILDLFEHALQLRAQGADKEDADEALHDELIGVEKRLVRTLLPSIWSEWGPHAPSPANDVLDGDCFMPDGYILAACWPKLQQGRHALLVALAERQARIDHAV